MKMVPQLSGKSVQRSFFNVSGIRTYRIVFLIIFSTLLFGCVATELPPPTPDGSITRLAALAPHTVQLNVQGSPPPFDLGHQYLLVAIPFGSITLAKPIDTVTAVLFRELAIVGINGVATGNNARTLPTLTVTVDELTTSAYDLLVVRRVVAHAALRATLTLPGSPDRALELLSTGESSSFERFGFTPQLQAALDEALAQAAQSIAITLQSSRAFRYDSGRSAADRIQSAPESRTVIRRAL